MIRQSAQLLFISLTVLCSTSVWAANGKGSVGGATTAPGKSVGGPASTNSQARGTVGGAATPASASSSSSTSASKTSSTGKK